MSASAFNLSCALFLLLGNSSGALILLYANLAPAPKAINPPKTPQEFKGLEFKG